jgi:hypothetical protein
MNLTFKQFFLLKEDPDSVNFRIGSDNYYARFSEEKYNPITFNLYNKNFLVYSPTEFNYHNHISRKLMYRIFDPLFYYKTYRESEFNEFKNNFSSSYLSFDRDEMLNEIKRDLEKENIYFIGDFNKTTISSLEKIHDVEKLEKIDKSFSIIFSTRPKNTPNFIIGRMFSIPIEQFQGKTNESLIPCFSLWNSLKDLTPQATEMILKLPPIYDLDPNKSIIENPGLESKMLRYFLK